MKITIIGPVHPFRGGIAHHTAMLTSAFSDAGHQTQVISFSRQYPSWLYPGRTDQDPSKMPLKTGAIFELDPFKPWTWISAGKLIEEFTPQAVVIQWWTTFWALPFIILAKFARKRRIPIIFLIHNVLPHESRRIDKPLAYFALRQGDAFVVQTNQEKDRLKGLIGNKQIAVCRHPNYIFFGSGDPNKLQAREKLSLPQDKFVLLFFGLIRSYKGLGILLDALGLLRCTDIFPHLIIAGEFWDPVSRYEKQIMAHNLFEQVSIHNRYIPDDEVSSYFTSADCLVAPYIGGTQSGVATIALSFGLPMIVTENIADGIECDSASVPIMIVPAGDAFLLAEAIKEIMQNPASKFPRERIQQKGNWDLLVNTIVSSISP